MDPVGCRKPTSHIVTLQPNVPEPAAKEDHTTRLKNIEFPLALDATTIKPHSSISVCFETRLPSKICFLCYLFAYYAPVYRCVQSCQLLFPPKNDKKAKFLLFSTKKIQLAKRLIMSPINPLHYIEMFMTTTNYNSQKMVSLNNELPPRLHMRLTAYVTCILHIYFFQFKSKESS